MNNISTILNPPEGLDDILFGATQLDLPQPGENHDPALEARRAVEANAERLIDQPVYTHVTWRAKPGRGEELIAAWNVLADIFTTLAQPPIEVTLIRRADDPEIFHSIGSWRSLADAQAVSDCEEAIDAVAVVASLCSEGAPAVYEIVRRIRPE